ncbi:hypothetical protein GCM10027168_68180 [Streptomyces capparidis]
MPAQSTPDASRAQPAHPRTGPEPAVSMRALLAAAAAASAVSTPPPAPADEPAAEPAGESEPVGRAPRTESRDAA